MHIKIDLLFLIALLLLFNTTFGKDNTKHSGHKKHSYFKNKLYGSRSKRSMSNEHRQFGPPKSRRYPDVISKLFIDMDSNKKVPNDENDPPFWGTRGRRDNSSNENRYSSNAYNFIQNHDPMSFEQFKESRDEIAPFWGNRGRKKSEQIYDEDELSNPFWGNRGRRQEDDPFWGARGRRQEDTPFWGNRGRRESSRNTIDIEEDPPFWGNRGRRDEEGPFWGSRGRRQELEPFWGSRLRENKYKHKENLKDVLTEAINKVEDNIEHLIRSRKDGKTPPKTFWDNRGRDSQINFLFKGNRQRYAVPNFRNLKPSESSTVLDDRMFAEQPHYILVERTSRSSAESDPFFISRGKKKIFINDFNQSNRDRRGAIEELVKSVRNDPYYIARGKKSSRAVKMGNVTIPDKNLGKVKEMICSTLDLVLPRIGDIKVKREIDENDRDRRTILKKLAAQLQMDPYFVSRGKKSDEQDDSLEDLMNKILTKCT